MDSVVVSLNQGMATVKLKPGNTVALEQLRRAVERNGFVTKEAQIVARGLLSASDKPQLKVLGSNEIYDLNPAPSSGSVMPPIQSWSGKAVLVTGTVPATHKAGTVTTLQVKSITLAPQENP